MLKKFTKPFIISLSLLLSASPYYAIQEPDDSMSMESIDCALVRKDCCSKKKCKCKKFCDVNVTRNLRACSLIIRKNANINGDLAVAGQATFKNGAYPKLNQSEQIYNLRGTVITNGSNVELSTTPPIELGINTVNVNVSGQDLTTKGSGYTISKKLSGSGILYTDTSNNTYLEVILETKVTFNNAFSDIPTVTTTPALGSKISAGSLNNDNILLQNVLVIPTAVNASGFNLDILLLMKLQDSSSLSLNVASALINGLLSSGFANFIVEGNR